MDIDKLVQAVRPEVLARQLGPKAYPKCTYEDIMQCPQKIKALRKTYSELPFFAFMRSAKQGQSFGKTFITIVKTPKTKKPSAIKLQKEKDLEELRLLAETEAEIKKQTKIASLAATDLSYLKTSTASCLLENTNPIHHNLALYLFLYCINIREALFQNILLKYSLWSTKNKVPDYDIAAKYFDPLFSDDSEQSQQFVAYASIIHVVKSLLVANFSLRARIISEGDQQSPFVFNVAYQKLYVDSRLRQFSLALLDSNLINRGQKEFIELFTSISYFESFVCGPEFNAFRMAFPIPKIQENSWPSDPLQGLVHTNAIDFIMVHALSNIKPTIKLSKKWSEYMERILIGFTGVRATWKTNMEVLENWLCGNDVPCISEFDNDFKELFSIYFGNLRVSNYQVDKKMDDLFFCISYLAKCKFGAQKESVNLEDAALLFLLMPKDLSVWTSKIQAVDGCLFPFSRTLEEIWKPLFDLYKHDAYSGKIKRNWALVKYANLLHLK